MNPIIGQNVLIDGEFLVFSMVWYLPVYLFFVNSAFLEYSFKTVRYDHYIALEPNEELSPLKTQSYL